MSISLDRYMLLQIFGDVVVPLVIRILPQFSALASHLSKVLQESSGL
jgi:hypothetical protein